MPRAKDNRPVVGTAHCGVCATEASFLQVQKGNRAGYLYKRCGCGTNQNSGAPQQKAWLRDIVWRDVEGILVHPMQDKASEPEPEPEKPEPVPEPKRGQSGTKTLIGASVALCALVVAFIPR